MDYANGLDSLTGHTALVEAGPVEVTGTVTAVKDHMVVVSCDHDTWPSGETRHVSISVFAPEALFRLSGKAVADGREVLAEPGLEVERIQRRRWPRRRM